LRGKKKKNAFFKTEFEPSLSGRVEGCVISEGEERGVTVSQKPLTHFVVGEGWGKIEAIWKKKKSRALGRGREEKGAGPHIAPSAERRR